MCQGTTPASSAPWSSPTPEACWTFGKTTRIHHWFPIFHCYVSFSWFLPKGQLQTWNHLRYRSLSGLDAVLVWTSHLWTVGIWYLRMGRMVNGKGQSNQSLCSMTATLGAQSPPAPASNSNIITQKMQRLCCTACSQTNFMRRLLHRCSCFCCLDQAILNTWTKDGFHIWLPHAHQNSNPGSLSTVLLKFQNSSARNAQTV